MIFHESRIGGCWIIDIEPIADPRGFFAVTLLPDEFAGRGMKTTLAQSSMAFNARRGTLRGMHFQQAPHGQAKLVRVTRGALLDVVVDLREESPTFRQWDAVELTADNRRGFYMPEGIAHGYLTLADETEASYQLMSPRVAASESGVRWDDPAFAIKWPFSPNVISDRDRQWPLTDR